MATIHMTLGEWMKQNSQSIVTSEPWPEPLPATGITPQQVFDELLTKLIQSFEIPPVPPPDVP